ncbi:MAG: MlaA family lipoprotein [Alphaproteobacteria bacterium]
MRKFSPSAAGRKRGAPLLALILALLVAVPGAEAGAGAGVGASENRPFSRQRFLEELRGAEVRAEVRAEDSAPPEEAIGHLERFNRLVFAFNQRAVTYVIDPTANFLGRWLPEGVQEAGYNVYSNLVEPEFIVTNLMTGDYPAAGVSTKRFLLNTTVGLVGLWDPASRLGLHRKEVEFTAGLCAAGLEPGAYLVLPLVGPTNTRASGLLAGFFALEWWALAHISPTLATADLVVDLSASAAGLRYSRDLPAAAQSDPYSVQKNEYEAYLLRECHTR